MKDLLHDHLAFGFHEGCPACDQVAEVFQTNWPLTLTAEQARRLRDLVDEGTIVPPSYALT